MESEAFKNIRLERDLFGAIVVLRILESELGKFDRLGLGYVKSNIRVYKDLHQMIEDCIWALRYAIETLKSEPEGEPRDSVIAGLEFLKDGFKKFDRFGLRFVEGMIYATEDLHPFIEVDRWALRYAIQRLRDQDQRSHHNPGGIPC
jgi:hypothetical protein